MTLIGVAASAAKWFLTEDRGPVRWLTLNRPVRKNAIPSTGWRELRDAFVDFDGSTARVLVVAGAGGSFCSGADLDPDRYADAGNLADQHRRMKIVGDAALALHRLTKPTIAAVDWGCGKGRTEPRSWLALEVVQPDGLDAQVAETAQSFLEGAPMAQMFSKQGMDRVWHLPVSEAVAWEGLSQALYLGTEDVVEGVSAFIERRPPSLRGR